MTRIRCGTVKWLSRRSIGQLIIIFASPSLPLIALMSVMECGSRDETGVGVACSLAEMGLMLCGAAIGVMVAFEIYQERKRKDEGRDGRPDGSGWSSPKGGSKVVEDNGKRSVDKGRDSKNAVVHKGLTNGIFVTALITIAISAVVFVYDTDMQDTPSNQTPNSVAPDAAPSPNTEADPLGPGTLFTASATILGLAVFGSALFTPGKRKDQIKSIAYTLVPFITVQALFMISLVSSFHMPVVWWVGMTAVGMFIVVAVMVANSIATDENARSSGS